MPLFEQAIAIDNNVVSALVLEHWNIKLGKIIKASQNHTFEASREESDGKEVKYSVRVTPDPQQKHLARIEKEVFFVNFVKEQSSSNINYHLDICHPVISKNGQYLVHAQDLIIVVFTWAKGQPLSFFDARWRTDPEVGFAWGRALAEFHQISQEFSKVHPNFAKQIQKWDEVHEGIAKGTVVAQEDLSVVEDINHYGVLHGDLNISNFFFVESENSSDKTLSVFDWDQAQQGWYLLDLAQAEFSIYMLAGGGSLIDGTKVEDAIPERFEQYMVDGYESVFGNGHVDRERLRRMVEMRMYFYETFCRSAKAQGDLPPDMEYFINYVIRWFDYKKLGIRPPSPTK